MNNEHKQSEIILNVINDDNFLSPYSPTLKPIISNDVAEFIENWANEFHPNSELSLRIISNCIDDNEKKIYNEAIRNYFKLKLKELHRTLKMKRLIGIIFSIIGILVLAFMYICDRFAIKAIWIECINIFAWVFVWEAVDTLFIERRALLLKERRLLALIAMPIHYETENKKVF